MIPSRSLPQGLGSRALLGPLRCGDPGSTVWQSAGFAGRGSRKYRDTCAAVLFMASSAMKSSKYKIRVPSYRTPKNLSKQLIMKYYDQVWNEGDTAMLKHICSQSLVFLDVACWPEPYVGPDAVTKVIEEYLSAYKAIRFSDVELLVTEDGSAVMAHWKATAFHLGAFLGTPASGKVQEIRGMSSFMVVDDKIARIETFREQLIHEQAFSADYGL